MKNKREEIDDYCGFRVTNNGKLMNKYESRRYVVVGDHCWGLGETLNEAIMNCGGEPEKAVRLPMSTLKDSVQISPEGDVFWKSETPERSDRSEKISKETMVDCLCNVIEDTSIVMRNCLVALKRISKDDYLSLIAECKDNIVDAEGSE